MQQPRKRSIPKAAGSGSAIRHLAGMLRPYAMHLSLTLLMLLGLALVNMAVPAFLGILFNEVFEHRLWRLLVMMLIGLLVVYVIRNLLYYATKYTAVNVGEHICFELRKQLFERLQSQSMRFYRSKSPGQLSSRVMDDTFVIQSFIQDDLPKILQGACLFLGLVAVLYAVNWQFALVSTIILPVHFFAARYFKGPIKKTSRHAQEQLAVVHGSLIEKFLGMEVIKGFAAEDRENAKFVEAIDNSRESQLASKRFHVKQKVVADLLLGMGTVSLLGFGSYQVMKDNDAMQPGTFIAFFGYVGMLYPTVVVLMSGFAKISRASACIERIVEMLEAPTIEDKEVNPVVVPIRGGIVFEQVDFSYEESRLVLENVSFEVPAGSVCVIMGPSGSGKTTLLSLITRFIDPDRGRILIDDIDAQRIQLKHLRESIGIAFQETFLFNASVLENLRYAQPEVPVPRIIETAKRTGAHDFIKGLPDGYQTMLGGAGVNLSRGEKQRLVLTRALLKDPKVLILDEATASIDVTSQSKIIPAVIDSMNGRTILMVTHRPEVLGYADIVIRLEGGRIRYAGPPKTARRPAGATRAPRSTPNVLLAAAIVGLLTTAAIAQPAPPPPPPPGNAAEAADPAAAPEAAPGPEPVADTAAEPAAPPLPGAGAGVATGEFFPLHLTNVALQEMFDVFLSHARTELGYVPAGEAAAARLPAPPSELTKMANLARPTSGGVRLLQVGYKTYETQPPHVWVYGGTAREGSEQLTGNPDVQTAMRLLRESRENIGAAFTTLKVSDLATKLVTLSYVEPDRCLAILKTLGYATIEYSKGTPAAGNQTIIEPNKPVDPKNLPIIVDVPGTLNTQLVGGAQLSQGAFGIGVVPTVASDLPGHTSSAPLMQLMILYHPDHPEQLSEVIDRIETMIDLPARQVLIEALVLEISEVALEELGVEWELTSSDPLVDSLQFGKLPVDLSAERATLNLSINDVFGDFRVQLRALVQEGKAKVLSRPSVLTLDNRQASIRVGEEIPIATSVAGTRNSDKVSFDFKYIPTGILLNIRPRVTAKEEEVSLQIDAIVSDEVPGQELVIRDSNGQVLAPAPAVSTRRVQAHIRIDNNTPFIIGGLIAETDSTTVEKVPLLGDLPVLGGLFRNRSVASERNEVIIVITPFVLPETGLVGRNLPKDKDAFDSFDNELFRDAYRIRTADVFDLTFIKQNRYLGMMDTLANRMIQENVELADVYPYNQFAADRFPGEHILVYRQMYEVIKRLEIAQDIQESRIIFFQPDGDSAAGFSVTFLEPYLQDISGITEEQLEELDAEQRAAAILRALDRTDRALAMTYTERHGNDIRDAVAQPVPELNIVDCPDEAAWQRLLWEFNQPGPDGRPRHTILLRSEDDLTRLKRAIVLKSTVRLNAGRGALTLSNFAVGRLLLMPDITDEKVSLIDSDTARYFFLTEHYYPAFVEQLSTHTNALRRTLENRGVEIPHQIDPSLPPTPTAPLLNPIGPSQ